MRLYSWDYTINHNENRDENEKKGHIGTTQIDLGLDIETNIVNIKSVLVWWWLYVLSNIRSSVHENVKQDWGWTEKELCL